MEIKELQTLIGANIKRIRKEKGLTQWNVMDKALIDRPYISDIERGKANATIDTLLKISRALEVDIKSLFDVKDKDGCFLGLYGLFCSYHGKVHAEKLEKNY